MRILLAVNFDVEARLIEGIIRAGHEIVDRVTGAESLTAAVERYRPDLVLAQTGPETLNRRSLTACDAAGARTIGIVVGEAERRHAHELGLVDRISGEAGWDAVAEVLTKPSLPAQPRPVAQATPETAPGQAAIPRHERRDRRVLREREGRASRAKRRGEQPVAPQPAMETAGGIIAVWGPHGSPGVSTTAVALAALCAQEGARVLLIDADSYGGAVALMLGITDDAPGFAAACRLAGAGSLTGEELTRVSAPVPCAQGEFRVLVGTNNPARWPEFSAARVRQVLSCARSEYNLVIVDVGFNLERDEELMSDIAAARRNSATHTALEVADTVIAVGEATPVGMQRYLRARLALGDLLGEAGHVETVINRLRRTVTGADSATQVRQVLLRFGGIEQATLLPDDPRAADRALAEAIPICDAAPRSQITRQLTGLAARLCNNFHPAAHNSLSLSNESVLVQ